MGSNQVHGKSSQSRAVPGGQPPSGGQKTGRATPCHYCGAPRIPTPADPESYAGAGRIDRISSPRQPFRNWSGATALRACCSTAPAHS